MGEPWGPTWRQVMEKAKTNAGRDWRNWEPNRMPTPEEFEALLAKAQAELIAEKKLAEKGWLN